MIEGTPQSELELAVSELQKNQKMMEDQMTNMEGRMTNLKAMLQQLLRDEFGQEWEELVDNGVDSKVENTCDEQFGSYEVSNAHTSPCDIEVNERRYLENLNTGTDLKMGTECVKVVTVCLNVEAIQADDGQEEEVIEAYGDDSKSESIGRIEQYGFDEVFDVNTSSCDLEELLAALLRHVGLIEELSVKTLCLSLFGAPKPIRLPHPPKFCCEETQGRKTRFSCSFLRAFLNRERENLNRILLRNRRGRKNTILLLLPSCVPKSSYQPLILTFSSELASAFRALLNFHNIISLTDEQGVVRQGRLKVLEVWSLPLGQRVVVPFNAQAQPVGEAAGLLSGFLGLVVTDIATFPISYHSWDKVPNSYKESCFNSIKVHKLLDGLVSRTLALGQKRHGLTSRRARPRRFTKRH
ncbi:protein app1 isoform X6 [Senna tora]|uniref:Protein app1 isoform X6 n=1 Tax=Senna tora TaxID=362788 RepID=A0A834THC0_9FABA|nr:protein app1 isoform X6 [Senna tora]